MPAAKMTSISSRRTRANPEALAPMIKPAGHRHDGAQSYLGRGPEQPWEESNPALG
jgi:hypothetical protein